MRQTISHRVAVYRLVLTVLLFVFVTGCSTTKPSVPPLTPSKGSSSPLLSQAESAYLAGRFAQSERLSKTLLADTALTVDVRTRALELFAKSAVANGHPNLALEALDQWASVTRLTGQEAQLLPTWRQTWQQAVLDLPDKQQAQQVSRTMADNVAVPWDMRIDAILVLAKSLIQVGKEAEATSRLASFWNQLPDNTLQSTLEESWGATVSLAETPVFQRLATTITQENRVLFPYAVIALEEARRRFADPAQRARAWQSLTYLQANARLASDTLVTRVLQPLQGQYTAPEQKIALCLPLTGQYSAIGWEVMRGATIARKELAQDGITVSISAINTDAEDWTHQLASLPPDYVLTGGPLRAPAFQTARQLGLEDQRRFFTFLPSLDNGIEGARAWRFFPAAEDQINTLVRFTTEHLGITSLGTLAPDDPFGRHMTTLFRKQAGASPNVKLFQAFYKSGDINAWGESVRHFLGAQRGKNAMPPRTPFQAVFLPDGWSSAEILVPYFFFYQEDRLVLLGSSLWGRGLAAKERVSTQNFGLAVFPDPWNPQLESPAARRLAAGMERAGFGAPSFWSALGYDFIRFGLRLGLAKPIEAAELNAQLPDVQHMEFSMAPLTWDAFGMASQHLFLFQPTDQGIIPLDAENFSSRLDRVRRNHSERLRILRSKASN